MLTEEDVSSDRRKVEIRGETLQHKTVFFYFMRGKQQKNLPGHGLPSVLGQLRVESGGETGGVELLQH